MTTWYSAFHFEANLIWKNKQPKKWQLMAEYAHVMAHRIHSHAMYNIFKCNIHDYTVENFKSHQKLFYFIAWSTVYVRWTVWSFSVFLGTLKWRAGTFNVTRGWWDLTSLALLSIECNSIRLGGHSNGMTKTVHKSLPGGVGGEGWCMGVLEMVGVGVYQLGSQPQVSGGEGSGTGGVGA